MVLIASDTVEHPFADDSSSHRSSNGILFFDGFVEWRFIVDRERVMLNGAVWSRQFCIRYGTKNVEMK